MTGAVQPTHDDLDAWVTFFRNGGRARFAADQGLVRRKVRASTITLTVIAVLFLAQLVALLWLLSTPDVPVTFAVVVVFMIVLVLAFVRVWFARRALRIPRQSTGEYLAVDAEHMVIATGAAIPWSSVTAVLGADERGFAVPWHARFGQAILKRAGAASAELVVGLRNPVELRANAPRNLHPAYVITMGKGAVRLPVENALAADDVSAALTATCAAAWVAQVPSVVARDRDVIVRWTFGLMSGTPTFDPRAEVAAMGGR